MNPFHPTNTPLDAVGRRHKTDKSSDFHDYLNRYEPYFSSLHPAKILEVGVDGGASIRTWAEHWPNAQVIGVDHNPECSKLELPSNASVVIGNQNDPYFWMSEAARMGNDFDIIIDDGNHTGQGMITTFQGAWPRIRPGGIYCVEDLHSSYLPEYNRDDCSKLGDGLQGAGWPAIRYFTRLVSTMNQFGKGECGDPKRGESDIGFMHFSRSLLIIGKR